MYINNIYADGFKNLKNVSISPDKKLNIMIGENAQGKTNLFEAVWLLTGCRSFRGSREKDFIGFEEDKARIDISFTDNLRQQQISCTLNKMNLRDRKITLNGVPVRKNATLFENFKCVIFTPEDLELAKGSPDNRRNFIDLCISQIKPKYINAINRCGSVLSQRNALLKSLQYDSSNRENISIWDEQLAKIGAYITIMRFLYVKQLNLYCERLYDKISGNGEKLDISYNSSICRNLSDIKEKELSEIYLERLKNSVDDDIKAGFTSVGVHRDDIITKLNGLISRDFGSQGQNRSIALCMKMAQAEIFSAETGESPIILLDDVFSELDLKRRKFIMELMENMQVFISSCDVEEILRYRKGKVFHIKNGEVLNEIP